MRKGESQKREDAGARKGRKVTKHCVFPLFCGSGGSKSRLAQAAGAEPAGQMKDEKFNGVARSTFTSQNVLSTSAWREARFEVKMYKAPQLRSTFGSCDVEEVHAIARHCGAKHMWKSKCTKHTMFGRRLEVATWKSARRSSTQHMLSQNVKVPHVGSTFGRPHVANVHAVVARSTFESQKCQKPRVSSLFL